MLQFVRMILSMVGNLLVEGTDSYGVNTSVATSSVSVFETGVIAVR